jgi:hypothetical protein
MEPTEAAIGLYRDIAEALDNPALEPDPTRTWTAERERLDDLWRRVEHDLVPGARAAYREPSTAAIPPGDLAGLLLELAALFAAASLRERAVAARDHAASMVPSEHPVRELIDGAKDDPDAAYAIVHAQWKARHRDVDGHDAVLRKAQRSVRDARMKAAIARLLDGPRPVKSAPTLATLNGVGTMLYGSRDAHPDGSYVATRFFTFVFVPVLPLDAWRVRPGEGNSYYFLAKEPLSGLVRNYRRLMLGAALALGVASPVQSWYASPARLASRALDEASAFAQTHPAEASLARYQSLVRTYAVTAPTEAQRAAEAVITIVAARVERPATLAQQPRITEVIRTYDALPDDAKGMGVRRTLAAALERWESELGDGSLAAMELRGTLLHTLRRAGPPEGEGRWRAAEERLEATIARQAGAAWPVDAVSHALGAGDLLDEATTWAWVEPLLRSTSLTRYAQEELRGWVARAHDEGHKSRVSEALARAAERAENPARAAALQSNDRAQLAAARTADPSDQEVALALVGLDYATGDDAVRQRCLAELEALGPFGAVVPDVQSARAGMMFSTGRGAEADRLVETLTDLRLPTMRRVLGEARERRSAEVQRYIAQARTGALPSDLQNRLEHASETEQREIFRAWVGERLGQDQTIRALDERGARYAPLVGTVLSRGRWLLREANERSGSERQAMLERTRAVFLSVSSESEDSAEYRLAMGQVEHQLGRAQEGEALLGAILRDGTVTNRVSVAAVYQRLGLLARAREVADRAWEASTDAEEKKSIAAFRLTFPATLEDEELWLSRADDHQLEIRIQRKQSEAHRALRDGHLADADRLLLEARALYTPDMLLTSAGANNAAILDLERFSCTGDVSRLESARAGLETALRRIPENSTVVHNLAIHLNTLAVARLVEPELRLRALRPGSSELVELVMALRDGANGPRLAQATAASADLRRGSELALQLETLSPSASSTWSTSWGLASTADDLSAVEALAARLARAPRIEAEDSDRRRALADTPEQRTERRQSAEIRLREADQVLTDAEATHHAPTIAAAHAMRAWRRQDVVNASDDFAQADAVVTDLRAAMTAAPNALDLRVDLASALLRVAVAHAIGDDARAAFSRDQRTLNFPLALAQLAHDRPAVRDAIRTSPEATEAMALLGAVDARRVSINLRVALEALGAPSPALTAGAARWLLTHDAIGRRVDRNDPAHARREAFVTALQAH